MTSAEFPILSKIITTLAGFASQPIKNKLERTQLVIKLLKKFRFTPEHPPADFPGVYAYTLVEYGIGKPQPILELFQQDEIRQAFREAFEQNDSSILLDKGEEFIDGYALGDQIKEIGINPLLEFATFAMHFLNVTQKTRTPAEVVTDQKIDNVQRDVSNIESQLARLTTSQEVLLEFAQQAKEYQSLQPSNNSDIGKISRFILAQQLRSWFSALKYDIEKNYEVEEDTYFEFIINIPARRGYERILIRGVEGEASLADVRALRKAVNEQRTKEGWLVAARRISPAACKAANEEDNKDIILCYTFDQLLDEDADFSKYLDWLEAEVKRRGIDTMYVPLACTKDEFDPITKEKIDVSKYDADNGWIEGYIDRWLDDRSKEHISILGEFGTGKTWLTLHYAWKALQDYRAAKANGTERPRIPLVIPLRDYAKAVSVESLFSEFFFRKYEIPLPGYSVFEQLNRMGKLLLIFDGFDEMADRVDSQKMINNFWELSRVVVPGSKAILTCRTEHFPEAKEGRALLNAELKASISALTGEPPQFEVLELEKFNDEQIQQVLSFRTGASTVKEIMDNPELRDLARRPVMTELILEALPEIEAGKPIDMSRIYLYAVREKMKRDIKAERTFTSLADKLYFLCELSWEMLSTDQMSLNYRLFPDRLRRLFSHAVQEQKHLDHWHYDMMAQTMLIRNADGDYMPAHRSLLEFFVAYKFAAELGVLAPDFLELAQEQSHLTQDKPTEYTWSSYFRRSCSETGEISRISPLKNFIPEDITLLASTVGKEPLATENSESKQTTILKLISNMLSFDKKEVKEKLLTTIRKTCHQLADNIGVIGGNVVTILCHYDTKVLRGENLVGTNLRYADFSNADFSECDFSDADLSNSYFNFDTLMYKANLKNSILNNINNRKLKRWTFTLVNSSSSAYLEIIETLENSGRICFLYPFSQEIKRKLDQGIKRGFNKKIAERLKIPTNTDLLDLLNEGEEKRVLLLYMKENSSERSAWRIESIFVINYLMVNNLLYLLTLEGDYFGINIVTGEILVDDKSEVLRTWKNANFENVQGLTQLDVYLFKALGSINLPSNLYILEDDKTVNQVL